MLTKSPIRSRSTRSATFRTSAGVAQNNQTRRSSSAAPYQCRTRAWHNEGGFPDGTMRQDIDADGTAPPFQRPLDVPTGPGSMSGAESFAGPLQTLGRATLVGEQTGGLCG